MMRIGAFSKATGLSVKALRLYDKRGILPPAWVDSWTRYRYYDETSLRRAKLIAHLRSLEVPLADITAMLAHDDTGQHALQFLEKQRATIRAKLNHYGAILQSLEATLDDRREVLMSTTPSFHIDRNPQTRLQAWLERVRNPSDTDAANPDACFTLNSLCGLGGEEAMATVLARRTGFDAWDASLLDAFCDSPTWRSAILATLDEAQRHTLASLLEERPESSHPRLELLGALALQGRALFLGMGAGFFLGSERALRVRLAPTWEALVPHHAKRSERSLEDAEAHMQKERERLLKEIRDTFDDDLENLSRYDLIVNSSTLNLYDAVDLVIEAFEARFTPESGWWYGGAQI